MGSSGYNEKVVLMEDAGDSFKACHSVQWFDVSVCGVGPC